MTTPLRELLADAQSGDAQALEELLERYLPGLRAYVRLQCGPRIRARESCSDLVQEVCIEVLRGLKEFVFRDDASFRGWLYRVAEQRIVDRYRYHGRQRRDPGREVVLPEGRNLDSLVASYGALCTPSRVLGSAETIEQIEAAFDRIAPRYRQVIVLARVVGLSYDDIGEELGVSGHYARTLLSRALAQLLKVLDEEDISHGFT